MGPQRMTNELGFQQSRMNNSNVEKTIIEKPENKLTTKFFR